MTSIRPHRSKRAMPVEDTRRARRAARRRAVAVPAAASFAALAIGGWVAVDSSQVTPPPPAPLPTSTFSLPSPAGNVEVPPSTFEHRDKGYQPHTIDPASLGRNTLAIPTLGVETTFAPGQKNLHDVWQIASDINKTTLLDTGVKIDAPKGTRVIAGHVDRVGEGPGALHDIASLRPGSYVVTTNGKGVAQWWVVGQMRVTPKDSPPNDIFDRKGPKRLALVTCGGQVHNGSYDSNVVVGAVPVRAPEQYRSTGTGAKVAPSARSTAPAGA